MNGDKISYTVTEASKVIGISRPTLYTCIKNGSLHAWRLWSRGNLRIHKHELERWMSESPNPKTPRVEEVAS